MDSNYKEWFTTLTDSMLNKINDNYKVLEVNYLSEESINNVILKNINDLSDDQVKVISEMSNYYLNHKNCAIYKKTEFLCNLKEKICIYNIHADNFRKLYDGINYNKDSRYVSFFYNL